MNINKINPEFPADLSRSAPKADQIQKGDFKGLMQSFFSEVNELQLDVDSKIEDFAAGNIKDVHQVMVAIEEADVAFQLMMEIRNKLLKAYQEIMKTPV